LKKGKKNMSSNKEKVRGGGGKGGEEEEEEDEPIDPLNEELRKKLVNGVRNGEPGILRQRDQSGKLVAPYTHQRRTIYEVTRAKTFFLIAHKMGLGKTWTAIMCIASHKLTLGRVPKTIIAVPSSLLTYWKRCVLNYLVIDPDTVLMADGSKKLTKHAVENSDIIIVSHGVISCVFSKTHHKVAGCELVVTPTGTRQVTGYVRKPGTALNPLFGTSALVNQEEEENVEEVEGLSEHDHAAVEEELNAASASASADSGPNPDHDPNTQAPAIRLPVYSDEFRKYDLFIADEAHQLRSRNSMRSRSFRALSLQATKRIGLTGTPVVNRQDDIASLCMALNAPRSPIDFTRADSWTYMNNNKMINEDTNLKFTKYVSRVDESDIDLPTMKKIAVNYNAEFDYDLAIMYNAVVSRARDLRTEIEQHTTRDGLNKILLAQLIAVLQKLSFLITCPLLAENGAQRFLADKELVNETVQNPSNAMIKLMQELCNLQQEGHRRIIVAGMHVSVLTAVSEFLSKRAPFLGTHFHFHGKLSQKQKDVTKDSFLKSKVGLFFLSIPCGGQGLHLVPGCNAMILFGAAPWSSASCEQLFKRIHRIGQTKEVDIRYMAAYGSVDASIYSMHGCKQRLEKLTVDTWKDATDIRSKRMDKRAAKRLKINPSSYSDASSSSQNNASGASGASGASNKNNNTQDEDEDEDEDEEDDENGEASGATWRKASRIVDSLLKVDESTGLFPPMPERVFDEEGNDVGAFTIVPGVKTRGLQDDVPEDAVPLTGEVESRENDEELDPPADSIHNMMPPAEEAENAVVLA
jgi:hypothetical protein